GVGIHAAAAAGDDPQIIFRQPAADSHAAKSRSAGAEANRSGINRSCPAHYRVRGRAQFIEMLLVALAAERRDRAVRCSDFAIRGNRHVDEDEREFRVACCVLRVHVGEYSNSKLKMRKLKVNERRAPARQVEKICDLAEQALDAPAKMRL